MTCARFALFDRSLDEVAAPRTIAEAQRTVREATGRAIMPWGGGTRQHIGYAPDAYDLALSTANLNAITEHSPGDFVVTSQAGVTLSYLQATLAQQGQWLPLDVALPDRQTVGGIVAGRAHSLCRFACGSVRDSLVGLKVIDHRGDLIVSDHNLSKLYCGSWGTLGLIVEASFRVAPLPEASTLAVLPLPAARNAEEISDRLLESDLDPSFLWLLNPPAARTVLGEAEDAQYLVIGFEGSVEYVAQQRETLGAPTLAPEHAAPVRARLRDFALVDAPMSVTFHILSSQVGAFARMVEWTARRAGFTALVAADAAVGIVYAHITPNEDKVDWVAFHTDLADKALRVGGSCIIERMPPELRAFGVPVWTPLLPDFALMARVKQSLDPHRMWNSGRFVGRL